MNIIDVTKENLQQEHICCAISNNKDCQVASKKQWLSERFEDGLVFKKGDVRGKCFIEYLPRKSLGARRRGRIYVYRLSVGGRSISRRGKRPPVIERMHPGQQIARQKRNCRPLLKKEAPFSLGRGLFKTFRLSNRR